MYKKFLQVKDILKKEKKKFFLKKMFFKKNEKLLEFLDDFFYLIENNKIDFYIKKEYIEIIYEIIKIYKIDIDKEYLIKEVKKQNILYMLKEKNKYKELFDTIESNPLTDKQRDAIVSDEKNNLILAGAGSGKTSVIMAKVKYLIEKGSVDKNEILILAFNKDAAEEIQERLKNKIGESVNSYTFHGFGNLIIKEKYNANLVDWLNDSKDENEKEYICFDDFVKKSILKYLKQSKKSFLEELFLLKMELASRKNKFNEYIPLKKYTQKLLKDKKNKEEFEKDLMKIYKENNLFQLFLYEKDIHNYEENKTRKQKISIFKNILPEVVNIMSMMNSYDFNKEWLNDVYKKRNTTNFQKILIKISLYVIQEYEDYKERKNYIDFDDMISLANKIIKEGNWNKKFKYIIIDEFQDISLSRLNLVKNIRELNEESVIMAVGDDWQAINGFAGSDVSIIQNFEEYMGYTNIIKLDMTFRYNQELSDIAANFITKNYIQVKKEVKAIKTSKDSVIHIKEYSNIHKVEDKIDKILKEIKESKLNIKSILLLGRYRRQNPRNIKEIINKYKNNFKITFQTVHSSKGREADVVIILPMDTKEFQFPSLKKKKESELLFFENKKFKETYAHAEERRLFYVGITRTKNIVYILSSKSNRSLFIDEIIKDNNKNKIKIENI